MILDPISIATGGYVCGSAPSSIPIATDGYVCFEEDGSTAGLGYQAERRRRKRRDDDDLYAIIMAFMQIKDD